MNMLNVKRNRNGTHGRFPQQGRPVNPHSKSTPPINDSRVLLISESRIWSEDIAKVIGAEAEVNVVAVAGPEVNILKEVGNANPDIVLADRTSVMVELLGAFPRLKVIGVHDSRSQPDILGCVKAGVSGFIVENATRRELLSTIRSVAQGRPVLPGALTNSLFNQIVEEARGGVEPVFGLVHLTRRESEISSMIAEGLTNKEIAQRLNISSCTVKSHVHNLLQKLGVHRRVNIIMKCRMQETHRFPEEGRGGAIFPMASTYAERREPTEGVFRRKFDRVLEDATSPRLAASGSAAARNTHERTDEQEGKHVGGSGQKVRFSTGVRRRSGLMQRM